MITFRPHSASITALSYTPDGTGLASVSHDRWVRMWDVGGMACQALRWEQVGSDAGINHCQMSPDGAELFTGGSDGRIRVWDALTGAKLREHELPSRGNLFTSIYAFVLSRTGKDVAWCGYTSNAPPHDVVVASAKSLVVRHRIPAHDPQAMILTAYDGGFASGSYDRTVKFWDWRTKDCYRTLKFRGNIRAMAVSPDAKRFAVAGVTTITVYTLAGRGVAPETVAIRGHRKCIECVEFSPDGTRLASVSRDGTLRLWDTTTGECKRVFALKLGGLHWVTFAPDGLTLAFSSLKGDLGLLDLDD